MEENLCKKGEVRVGRIVKNKNPSFENFKPIIVMTPSSAYGDIGPYCLKSKEGYLMENIWQFSKVYPKVPKTTQVYSRWNNMIIWDWPEEIHISFRPKDEKIFLSELNLETEEVNEKYWHWRNEGIKAKYAIRYPVGRENMNTCIYALNKISENPPKYKKLDYIEARKKIYVKVYKDLVQNHPTFLKLKEWLNKGINLLIIEIDGPHEESLEYYKNKYGVSDNFIQNDTILATKNNLDIMLNDDKHSYGHGYVLASALLDFDI
jgi:hypothetical protein